MIIEIATGLGIPFAIGTCKLKREYDTRTRSLRIASTMTIEEHRTQMETFRYLHTISEEVLDKNYENINIMQQLLGSKEDGGKKILDLKKALKFQTIEYTMLTGTSLIWSKKEGLDLIKDLKKVRNLINNGMEIKSPDKASPIKINKIEEELDLGKEIEDKKDELFKEFSKRCACRAEVLANWLKLRKIT